MELEVAKKDRFLQVHHPQIIPLGYVLSVKKWTVEVLSTKVNFNMWYRGSLSQPTNAIKSIRLGHADLKDQVSGPSRNFHGSSEKILNK